MISNIGRTRRQARSKKKQRWVKVSQLFLSETVCMGKGFHFELGVYKKGTFSAKNGI